VMTFALVISISVTQLWVLVIFPLLFLTEEGEKWTSNYFNKK